MDSPLLQCALQILDKEIACASTFHSREIGDYARMLEKKETAYIALVGNTFKYLKYKSIKNESQMLTLM